MWPMSDFPAVVFIMTVALLVALAQVGVTWLPLTRRWFASSLRNRK